MFVVKLDRSYYSLSETIFKYLRDTHNNKGDEWITFWEEHEGSDNSPYVVHQMFGYTTIKFKKEEDLNKFKEWVKTI
jgi:hypothetical protein